MSCKYKIGKEEFSSKEELKQYLSVRQNINNTIIDSMGGTIVPSLTPHQYSTDAWLGLTIRRVLKMAADEGYDRVGFVTGEQSADRYDLSKSIDLIDINTNLQGRTEGERAVYIKLKDNNDVTLFVDKNGKVVGAAGDIGMGNMDGKSLDEVLGKELAQKIMDAEESTVIKDDDLKVGGEGMKTFYNNIVPKVAKKEARRFDKSVDVEVVEFNESSQYLYDENLNELTEEEKQKTVASKQLSIPITQQMRENLNSAIPLFQGAQGAMLADDGKYVIYALSNPNVSTPLHEIAHVYEHYLSDKERATVLKWTKQSEWSTNTSEKFARGFEKYLAEGKAPNKTLQNIFDNFKSWLREIYNGIIGSDIDIRLNTKMREIYGRMFQQTPENGVEELSGLFEGKHTTTFPVTLFKGTFGKRNADGTIRSAHTGVEGSFSSLTRNVAERYQGKDDTMVEFDIPAGTTIEVVEISQEGQTASEWRKQETEAINNSTAQVVKLITFDSRGTEEQYVIKDQNLVQQASEFVTPEQQENVNEVIPDTYQFTVGATTIYFKERTNPITGQTTGEIEIDLIKTAPEGRNQGSAKNALAQFLAKADELGTDVTLFVSPRDSQTDYNRLYDFYSRMGFVSGAIEEEMTRYAKNPTNQLKQNTIGRENVGYLIQTLIQDGTINRICKL